MQRTAAKIAKQTGPKNSVAFAIFFAVRGFRRCRTTLSRPKNYIPIIIVF